MNEATPKGDNITIHNDDITANQKPRKKFDWALYVILSRGPKGVAWPEALMSYHESALNSTISSLRKKGIDFISEPDHNTISHHGQKPFNRYWLATDKDRQRAENLLNHYRKERGLPPLHFAPWHNSNDAA
jgi:hypothetical protein